MLKLKIKQGLKLPSRFWHKSCKPIHDKLFQHSYTKRNKLLIFVTPCEFETKKSKMKKILIVMLAMMTVASTFAQDEDKSKEDKDNLVPNASFEMIETKMLKKPGMLDEVCEGWVSGSREIADVFSAIAKSEKIGVPSNVYGTQDPVSENNYAGFRAYSSDSKLNRTYLTVELKEPMKANQQYCVKFNVSLADLSKYACNGLGMYISSKKIVQPNTNDMIKDAQIMHKTNKKMTDMEGWETICGTFTATGKERYIVIGNFMTDEKTNKEKVKKPRGVVGAQLFHAYYYLDDVEVKPIKAKSQCVCSPGESNEPDVIYSRNVVYTEEMSASDKVELHAVYFANLKTDINALNTADLKKLVQLLMDNPSLNVNVVGHCTSDEVDESRINTRFKDLGMKRAQMVAKYLAGNGIDESRLEILSLEDTSPANTRTSPLSIAQNRRVVFSVK